MNPSGVTAPIGFWGVVESGRVSKLDGVAKREPVEEGDEHQERGQDHQPGNGSLALGVGEP